MTLTEMTTGRPSAQKPDERIIITAVEHSGKMGGPYFAHIAISDRGRSDSNGVTVRKGGPMHAAVMAIRNMLPHDAKQISYSVHSVTEGSDAYAEVTIVLQNHKGEFTGRGVDIDTVVASVRAYVHALNQLLEFCKP